MIRIIPNFISNDLIDELITFAGNYPSAPWPTGIPNLTFTTSINHKVTNKIASSIGKLGNVELLSYKEGSYAVPHIDDYSWGSDFQWEYTGILLASEPEEYVGGEFVLDKFNMVIKPPKGTLIVFPAGTECHEYVHSVNNITSGTRNVIVYRFIK